MQNLLSMTTFSFNRFDWLSILVTVGSILLQILAVYIIFLVVRTFTNKVITASFGKVKDKENRSAGRTKTLEGLTKNAVGYVLSFILVVTILQLMGIKATAILAGAGVVGLAVGFGAQGLVSDVVTGFFILLERQLDVGDYITIGEFSGIVEQFGLRTTQIRDFDGTLHFIPNRQITSLSNHSRGNMRALVDISISPEKDVNQAMRLIEEACRLIALEESKILVDNPRVLGVESLDSNITIRVLARTVNGAQDALERKMRQRILEVLERLDAAQNDS
ncbi:mechanosensitive ion channel family protein [Peribacillus sp. SCS-155]|uniref:mechanosensitive ion channel family protein n=1 Tax=Peribacillus sedimenti TaxID=3115297 RepID=UPI0039058190